MKFEIKKFYVNKTANQDQEIISFKISKCFYSAEKCRKIWVYGCTFFIHIADYGSFINQTKLGMSAMGIRLMIELMKCIAVGLKDYSIVLIGSPLKGRWQKKLSKQ